MDKLLIVDGHNLLFRMYYGIPAPILNSEGKDIRAVIGFLGGLLKYINSNLVDKLIIVFDSENSSSANQLIDNNYKKNRIDYNTVPAEENPFEQLGYIYQILEYMKIEYTEVTEFEADDYIASLCRYYTDDNEITILSTDRDFLQLITPNITLYSPRGKKSIHFTEDEVFKRFCVAPNQIIDYKTLVGDNSDNISGIKSIGPKTAVKILKLGTLKDHLEGKIEIEESLKTKLIINKDKIMKNQKMILLNDKISIENRNLSINFDSDQKTMEIINRCGLS
ncbi:MAG: hypothetical protein OCD02_17235 [Spirochaetaceae bacterium]